MPWQALFCVRKPTKNKPSTIADRKNVEKKTISQQKEKPCNTTNNKRSTYASVSASGFKQQENNDHTILQIIARKKWQRTRSLQDKTLLNSLTSQLKDEIKQLKNDTISKYLLTNDSATDYTLWKTTKNLKRPLMQKHR